MSVMYFAFSIVTHPRLNFIFQKSNDFSKIFTEKIESFIFTILPWIRGETETKYNCDLIEIPYISIMGL